MKRVYEVRVERHNNFDHYIYNVVAADGIEAGRKAIRAAGRDSGFKTKWRVTNVTERPGYVIP